MACAAHQLMLMIDGIANLDNGDNTSVRAITNPDSIAEPPAVTANIMSALLP